MQPARGEATYADLLELPEDVRAELVAGEIVVQPSPRPRHSKSQRAKRRLYAEYDYWIVDPEARTLEAFSLVGGKWTDAGSFDETAHARIPPLEAVELPVGRLFLPKVSA
jgi:Uma2 family endonuclease